LIFSMWTRPSCTASMLLAISRIASNLPAKLTEQSPRLIDDCAQELILLEHERHQLGRVDGYDIWAKARHLQGLHLGQRPDYRSIVCSEYPVPRAMKTGT
jgi:hypothetical protein